MNSELLECKLKTKELVNSENPPRKENGRKRGYMSIMKDLWEERGYAELKLSEQNLRDQAAKLEQTLGNVEEVSLSCRNEVEVRNDQETQQNQDDINAVQNVNIQNANLEQELQDTHLHTTTMGTGNGTIEDINSTNPAYQVLLQSSQGILSSIQTNQGDFTMRKIDTRTKEKPKNEDLRNINNAVEELMEQNNSSPENDPFNYLWMANVVLYAVIVALLLMKGWKKQRNDIPKTISKIEKEKRVYEEKVKSLRRSISIAKAELERIKENRKITRKGRKNRKELAEECKTISSSTLVNFMKKQKTRLRKLKKSFLRLKKEKEARELNKQFEMDTGKVFETFNNFIAKDKDNENRPRYTNNLNERQGAQLERFKNIEEASKFWKELWEKDGIGNRNANWLEGMRTAINSQVPAPPEENDVELDSRKAVGVLKRKKN
ncbi:uncharacterized protein [Montipora foliosa]|uniref:uncharacterized protein n=1 Tax=Montipora foliosa TaxID=591990 RepID=UPI0035F15568